MTHESAGPDYDQQQVAALCGALEQRVETMSVEELLLADLATMNAGIRPFQSRRYLELLHNVRERSELLRVLIRQYCRRG